ncbi:MAG: hypothetical protein ACE5G1_03055 [bacterium]
MFETQTLLLVAGLALVIVGIVGGGLKVKEISVPTMGKIARLTALIVGIVLVLMGILENGDKQTAGDGEADYQNQSEYSETQALEDEDTQDDHGNVDSEDYEDADDSEGEQYDDSGESQDDEDPNGF